VAFSSCSDLFLLASPRMSSQSPPQPKDYDPRIGDEDGSRPDPQEKEHISPSLPPFPVAPKQESSSNCDKGKETANRPILSQRARASRFELPNSLHWIIDNWRWSKWQPAIRCAVSEWASLLLLIIGPSRRVMGQVRVFIIAHMPGASVYLLIL
jgi:hypothetical protein